ncbi:hypothetical protein ACOSQ2_031564 [Xanthoceras sorbifolium]
MTLEAQLAILIDQINENLERFLALAAENKDLQNKLDTMATTATPPPGFGHVRYEVNNPVSAPRQATPATRTNRRPSRALSASGYWYSTRRNESASSTKCGSRRPNDLTNSQHAFHTCRQHDRYVGHDFYFI